MFRLRRRRGTGDTPVAGNLAYSRLRRRGSIGIALVACAACTPGPEPVTLTGQTMGTSWSVRLPAVPPAVTATALRAELDAVLIDVNRQMSGYDPDSEISRFNATRSTDWVAVSPATAAVVRRALEFAQLTGGAFDITAGPLIDLWGFGPKGGIATVPPRAAVEAARRHVGFRRLSVQSAPPALRKTDPALRIDLSAIAKGYAVDALAARLDRAGATDYLVEIGGEIRVRGRPADDRPWRIGIEQPRAAKRSVQRVIPLRQGAIATSGDYRNFFEQDGKRYAHVIDPRTGRPVTHDVASVTVLAPDTMDADAWATALLVLGADAGLALAEREQVAALFLIRREAGLLGRPTEGFRARSEGS